MYTRDRTVRENESRAAAGSVAQKKNDRSGGMEFVDNRGLSPIDSRKIADQGPPDFKTVRMGKFAMRRAVTAQEYGSQLQISLHGSGVTQLESMQTAQLFKLSIDQRKEAMTSLLKANVAKGYGYALGKPNGMENYLTSILSRKKYEFDKEDIKMLLDILKDYKEAIGFLSFPEFVAALAQVGGKAERYAEAILGIKFANPPGIVFGFCLTSANYDSGKNVITLDPFKMEDDTAALDAALFECQNALQRGEIRSNQKITSDAERGLAIAKTEYKSDCNYIAALMAINGVTNIDDLTVALQINSKYKQEADFETCKTAGTVGLPGRDILSRQDQRTCLWHWKTKSWSNDQREFLWVRENHGPGVASTMEIYAEK